SVSVKCSNQTTTATGIKEIQVFTKGGKDSVEYELHTTTFPRIGTLAVSRLVKVDLGSNDDKFTSKIVGTLVKGSNVQLDVAGAAGKDSLKLVAGGFLNDGAVLRMNALGGDDADTIKLAYNGDMDGTLNLHLDGQGGNDKVAADLNTSFFVAKGDGVVGEVGNPAQVRGGAGNDKLRFRVKGPHLAG